MSGPINTHQLSSNSSVAFNLFRYRKELDRKKRRHVLLAKTKVELTEGLVSKKIPKEAKECNKEDLSCLMREVVYKQKLKRNIAKFEILMKMKLKQRLMTKLKHGKY